MESKHKMNTFTSAFEPSIAIKAYVERLSKYLQCSYEAYICAMCFIERIEMCTGVEINALNVHRLMLIALRVSTKFLDDKHHTNAYFAKVGGIATSEFNQLEISFLQAIQYRLYVDERDFNRMYALVEQGKIMKPFIVECSVSFDTSTCFIKNAEPIRTTTTYPSSESKSASCHELELEAKLAATANSVFSSVFDFDIHSGK